MYEKNALNNFKKMYWGNTVQLISLLNCQKDVLWLNIKRRYRKEIPL